MRRSSNPSSYANLALLFGATLLLAILPHSTHATPSAADNSCADDATYRSKLGLDCIQHSTLNCDNFRKVGFTDSEVEELLTKCPSSCGVGPCPKSSAGDGSDEDAQQQQGEANSMAQGRVVARTERLLEEQEACFPGWDVTCQDSPTYRGRLNLDCGMHIVIDCTVMTAIGFNTFERDELIKSCPCSCGIKCG